MKAELHIDTVTGRPWIGIVPESQIEQDAIRSMIMAQVQSKTGERMYVMCHHSTLNTSTPWGSGKDIDRLKVSVGGRYRPHGFEYTRAGEKALADEERQQ